MQNDLQLMARQMAAEMARISEEMLRECEERLLVEPKWLPDGGAGFDTRDVRRLARIRRLQTQLGLDYAGIEVALHMRRRIIEMQRQMEALERQMVEREQQLRRELRQLQRRLAEDANFD